MFFNISLTSRLVRFGQIATFQTSLGENIKGKSKTRPPPSPAHEIAPPKAAM
jgi:hypothetical protein